MITDPQLIPSLVGTAGLKRGAKPGECTYQIDEDLFGPCFRHPDLRGARRALLFRQHTVNCTDKLTWRTTAQHRAPPTDAFPHRSLPALGAGDIDGCLAVRKVHAELERSVRKGRSLRGARLSAVSRQKLWFCDLKYSSASGSTSIAVPN